MLSLENKIALITGAGRGIGKEIALTFAHQGAIPVICDVKEDLLQEAKRKFLKKQKKKRLLLSAMLQTRLKLMKPSKKRLTLKVDRYTCQQCRHYSRSIACNHERKRLGPCSFD